MLKTSLYHLFVPSGRTSRKTFWITLAAFAALVVAFKAGLFMNDTAGVVYFWGFLIWMTMLFCGIFAIYGKRLKDFGRSVTPIFGVLTLWIIVIFVFGILNGAGDYLAEFSQYERKAIIDEAVKDELNNAYQADLAGTPLLLMNLILWGILAAFTAWVGLTPGDEGDNRYGPPPQ
jgi:uncharacterized membrane protein YhaH (DUF805 family)